MSIERINLNERDVRSISGEIFDEKVKQIITAINTRFDKSDEDQERRERRLIEDLRREMMPMMGDFKDKAVLQSDKNVDDKIFRVFGVKTDDGKAIDDLRAGLTYARETALDLRDTGRAIRNGVRQWIIYFLIAAVVFAITNWEKFVQEPITQFLYNTRTK